jgi:CheY-like chemotaxis protein
MTGRRRAFSRRLGLRLACGVHPIATTPAGDQDRHVALRVLIVDDSSKFRDAAAELLAEMGFEVLAGVADANQALAAVADWCPDGILLDVNLPGRDGFSVATSLAAVCPAARIVLTSAELDRVPANILRTCAAVAFVPKQELAVADLGALFAG